MAGWGNAELQYCTQAPQNVSVKDSLLTIRALKEPLHGCGYTSARLKTRQGDGTPLFSKCYGRFETRAKAPWGKGLWPALWMPPQDDTYGGWAASGEIRFYVDDVQTCACRHWWSCSKTLNGSGLEARRASELNPWPAPFDQRFYLVMNVAVGSNFPGLPGPQTCFPAELQVDYVRVYDRVGGYGAIQPIGPGRFPWQKRKPAM